MRDFAIMLFAVILLFTASVVFAADDAAKLQEAWTSASRALPDEAMAEFKQIPASSPQGREAVYGQAMVLLTTQPITRGNINQSVQLFQSVVTANPSDDLGITAKYFLGRIEQIYRFEPDHAGAIAIYEDLFRNHPEHPVAQRAFVKLVILKLYDQIPDAERVKLFAEFEAEGSKLNDHDAVRDFHLVMAQACAKFGFSEEDRLNHLLAADAAGVVKDDTKANLLVSIAEVARKLNRKDLALQYYHRFMDEYPADYRVYTVQQRIAATEQPAP
jgi:tetratricopeptide (TPR) repeat protein